MITDLLVTEFIKQFALSKDLNPAMFISITIDVNVGVKYRYVDPEKNVIHIVEDLNTWAL